MDNTAPPRPTQRLTTHTEHGIERPDPYYWLNQKDNPEVIAYLEAENTYCKSQQEHLADSRKALYDEMLGRIQEEDQSAMILRGEYWYYTRTEEGKAYTIHCRRKGSVDAPEEVYLDENVLADGLEYFSLQSLRVSPNHRYAAYLADIDGGERFVLTIKDLQTGETLPQTMTELKWSLAWGADNATVFYCRSDEAQRPHKVFRWNIHQPTETEEEVFHEADEKYFLGVSHTRDHKWVLLQCHSKQTSLILAVDAEAPNSAPIVVRERQSGVEYDVSHRNGHFYLRINDNAQNFKVLRIKTDDPTRTETEVVPHNPEVFLTDLNAFEHYFVLSERYNGLPRLRIIDDRTGDDHLVAVAEEVYDIGVYSNPNFSSTTLNYRYTSLTTPKSIFQYDMQSREQVLLKQQPVVGDYEPTAYQTRRIWAKASDGVQVPISIVHRKGIVLDGNHAMYLRGYGSYGANYPVNFAATNVALLERGVILAIAHIRGGSEMGRHWYETGKFFEKKNTFTDFIACAEALIAQGYTSTQHLAIGGGSAGGLLMGAVINERPDLFKAVVARVPFVDVATTMSDPSIPLTVPEYEEWGDPNRKDVFEYMLSYSPYDQVKAQPYPALFVTAGLNDPRVAYWEPAKWVARLRDRRTNQESLLFKTHMGAGHGGASGRYGYLDDIAWLFAFILDELSVQ